MTDYKSIDRVCDFLDSYLGIKLKWEVHEDGIYITDGERFNLVLNQYDLKKTPGEISHLIIKKLKLGRIRLKFLLDNI